MASEGTSVTYIRQNPFKAFIAVITTVATMATAAWAFEDRYNQGPALLVVQEDVLDYQIRQVEDKIFELDLREENGISTPIDRAMNKRNKEYLKSLREKKKNRIPSQ